MYTLYHFGWYNYIIPTQEPDFPAFATTKVKVEPEKSVVDLTGVEQAIVDQAVAESLQMSSTSTAPLTTFVI